MAATVAGKTVAKGSKTGARAWLAILAPANVVPSTWKPTRSTTVGTKTVVSNNPEVKKTNGPYALDVDPGSAFGSITWDTNSILTFNITNGKVTNIQYALTNQGLPPDKGGPGGDTKIVGPGPDIISAIDSVPKFLEAITSKSLWVRIGIGAAGVGILAVALIIWIKEG